MLENKKLPNDWKLLKIMDVSDINPKLPNRDEIDKEIEVQFLPMKLIEAAINKIHLTETKKIIDAMKGSYTPFIDNDIIFAKVTPCMENGKIAVVNNLKNGIGFGSSEFHVLRPKKEVLSKYLFHYIIQDGFRNKAANEMTGAVGLRRVPKKFIENSLIPIPPVKIQSSIVSKIEELFSDLDKGIEDLKTAQQQLKIYRQSVLKWAFEGKLTNQKVKSNQLPKEWEMSTIGDIFEVFIGSTPKRNIPEYWGGNINWVSSGEIAFCNITKTREQITIRGLENTSCKVHPIGTVILAMIGEGKTRGQAAILRTEASHNQNTAAIRVNNNTYLSELLYYYLFLKYQDNRKVGSGNNQKALNKERVKNIEIPLPPLKEQHLIVQKIESRLSIADKMEESITQSLQQAEALRQSILKKAFSGELV